MATGESAVMLRGSAIYSIDDRNRLALSSKYRVGDNSFFITRGFEGCLYCFNNENWRKLEESFNNMPFFNADAMKAQRFLNFLTTESAPDNQGRITLTKELRTWAGLDNQSSAVVIGCVNRIEIWNKERFEEFYKNNIPEEPKELIAKVWGG